MRPRLFAFFFTATATLGMARAAEAQDDAPPPPSAEAPPKATTDDGTRLLELRAGWGVIPNFQQHSFSFAAHVFLSRRAAVGGQFEAYGDTVAYEADKRGTDYHHGGALEFEYVLYMRQLASTTTLELWGDAGAGATVTRPRTTDPVLRDSSQRDFTVVVGAGARVLFASRASIHFDLRDTTFPRLGLGTFVMVPRVGFGVAF